MDELAAAIATFKQDPDLGIRRVEWLHEQYPERVDVLYALGQCYFHNGMAAQAERAWRNANALDPTNTAVLAALRSLRPTRPTSASAAPAASPQPDSRMSVMDLPAGGSADEYLRRREEKERLDAWATARGSLPTRDSEEEYINLLARQARIQRKVQWRQQSPGVKAVAVFGWIIAAAIISFVAYVIITMALPALLNRPMIP